MFLLFLRNSWKWEEMTNLTVGKYKVMCKKMYKVYAFMKKKIQYNLKK